MWVPDDDWFFPAAMDDQGRFEPENIECALNHVPLDRRRVAVDGGAHIGTWTRRLCEAFDEVHAFEPQHENFLCLVMNTSKPGRAKLHRYEEALGDWIGGVVLVPGRNSGCYFVDSSSIPMGVTSGTTMRRLPELEHLDLFKLDVEGYEWFALAGAARQILAHHPTIVIEEKPLPHAEEWPKARTLLEGWGYREVDRSRRDVVFTHPEGS